MAPTGLIVEGRDHRYIDPADPTLNYLSVTSVISRTTGKGWLAGWGSGVAADFCVDRLAFIVETVEMLGKQAARDLIRGQAARLRELKSLLGSYQHGVLEALLLDRPLPPIPDGLLGAEIDGEIVDKAYLDAISDGLVNFIADNDIEVVMAEASVANPFYGYAGTLDLLVWMWGRKQLALLDCKTGQLDRSAHLQLTALRNATEVWVDDLGNKAPMPAVDLTGILHVRSDYQRGYKLYESTGLDRDGRPLFDDFLRRMRVANDQDLLPPVKGRPLYPPLADGSQPPPLLEDLVEHGLGRCVGPLGKYGVKSVADLSVLTRPELRGVEGIGEASMQVLLALAEKYDVALKPADPEVDLAGKGLGVRAEKALEKAGITTVADLAKLSTDEATEIIKGKARERADVLLADYGLAFAEPARAVA